ncbi:hypothetical protein [Amycolatopsis palatopharyngis]|nr:hypothetical protein [Amycolatopsis palatopharyngis]
MRATSAAEANRADDDSAALVELGFRAAIFSSRERRRHIEALDE